MLKKLYEEKLYSYCDGGGCDGCCKGVKCCMDYLCWFLYYSGLMLLYCSEVCCEVLGCCGMTFLYCCLVSFCCQQNFFADFF